MSQTVPTEPGWWWVEADGYETVIEVWEEVDYDAPRCSPRRGFVCSVDDERLADGVDGCDVSDGESVPAIVWLAPVAKHEEVERLRAEVSTLTLACEELLAQSAQLHAAVSAFVELTQRHGGAR